MTTETTANRKIEETLAKLSASVTVTRAKEPPDQQPVATPTRGWLFLPSVTQAPLVPEALPRLRLEPPHFDGENAPDWIHKIQKYYNHHYTQLDDRLYLTKYLFDHPASDWMAYWEENNKGKGWDDFLLTVKQRFDPDLYDDYVGRLAICWDTMWPCMTYLLGHVMAVYGLSVGTRCGRVWPICKDTLWPYNARTRCGAMTAHDG